MAKTQNSFHILMVSLCFVLLINNVKSDSLSLRFPNFAPRQNSNIGFLGDERPLDVYIPQVHLWDKTTGKLANLETSFSFVVDYYSAGFEIHPRNHFQRIQKPNRGYSFGNEWDPKPVPVAPHIGIDINTLESVETVGWPINYVPHGSVGQASIRYYADVKELSVVVGYFNTQPATIVRVLQSIDLRAVLPESVRIGFSGATGDKVETHDILSWSFNSRI
ncbi:Agglutinin-2 [Glycine soja]|uniref:Agglutinin-2 n=1 Tax=Glycine soja TaxID=3848 RepID=A0A445JKX2_GLYSO|nr:Agglutinin-2 [Glycine soja]